MAETSPDTLERTDDSRERNEDESLERSPEVAMRLIKFAIYLGIGAMMHALFVGATFDWTSVWTFGWLFGWPIMLFITFWAFALMAGMVAGLVYAVWMWLGVIAVRRERHRKRMRVGDR